MLIILLVWITFLNIGCSENISKNTEVFLVDTTLQLQEDENIIITRISKIDVSDSYFVLSDKYSSNIVVYNYSGKVINHFYPTLDMSDSIVLKCKPYQENSVFVRNKDYLDYYGNDESSKQKLRSLINNRFEEGIVLNDEKILVAGTFQVFQRLNHEPQNTFNTISNRSGIVIYNIKTNSHQIYNFSSDGTGYGQSTSIYKYNDQSICAFFYDSKWIKKYSKFDTIWCMAIYDFEGNYLKPLFQLPDYYIGLKFIFGNQPLATFDNQQYYIVFPWHPYVFTKGNNRNFRIKIESTKNERYFDYLNSISADVDKSKRGKYHFSDSTDLRVYNILSSNESIFIVFSIKTNISMNNKTFYIHEYDLFGNLIKEEVYDEKFENSIIEYITYSEKYNALLIFSYNDENWLLTTRKWEND